MVPKARTTLWAMLALLALPLAPVVAQEEPHAEPPPETDIPQEERETDTPPEPDTDVEPRPEEDAEEVGGFETPREASEAFLEGLKEDEYASLRTTLPPDVREGFDRLGPAWVTGITVNEYRIQSIDQPEEGMAHAYYEWDVEVDMSGVAEEFAGLMTESLREQGLEEEEIQMFLEMQMEVIRDQLRRQAMQMERPKQRMILAEIDGRWYVETPADEEYLIDEAEEEDDTDDPVEPDAPAAEADDDADVF